MDRASRNPHGGRDDDAGGRRGTSSATGGRGRIPFRPRFRNAPRPIDAAACARAGATGAGGCERAWDQGRYRHRMAGAAARGLPRVAAESGQPDRQIDSGIRPPKTLTSTSSVAGLAGVPPAMTLSLTTPNVAMRDSSKTKPIHIPERERRPSPSSTPTALAIQGRVRARNARR